MKHRNLAALLIGSLSITLALTSTAIPRHQGSPDSRYVDTLESFHLFLQDILDATKSGDEHRLSSLIKSTEIPNCDAWLHEMYKSDSADSWMGLCDPKTLSSKEKSLREQFAEFVRQGGAFSTRKVNDNPYGGERGLESGLVQGGKQPLEVYFASWKTSNQLPGDRGESIGYFYFLDGGFRWESGISGPSKIKISTAKFVPQQLIQKVAPVYPVDAAAQHITGTVRVSYVIGGDGKVYNAHALSGEGLSEEPSLRKAAEEAVLQWEYQPATMDGKPVEMGGVTADVTFQ
jgi:TonB family protein